MVNKVKQSIKEILVGLYPTYQIYLDEQEPANLIKPALRILGVKKTTSYQGEKHVQNIKLEIVCSVEDDDVYTLYWDISDKLDKALRFIDLEGIRLRTGEKTSEIQEGQLHYTFDLILKVEEEKEPTATMKVMDYKMTL